MMSRKVLSVPQVNAAICSASTMVHYVDASTATSMHAINGIQEFMSEAFKRTWASHFDKVRVYADLNTHITAIGLIAGARGPEQTPRWCTSASNAEQHDHHKVT